MSSLINIGIGIGIGIGTVVTIFIIFLMIRKPQVPGIPAIPTCGVGYTLEDDNCISTKTIPTICLDINGYSYEKNIDGICLQKCHSGTIKNDWSCVSSEGQEYNRNRFYATCPIYYTLKRRKISIRYMY
jgi:hypothetical protein